MSYYMIRTVNSYEYNSSIMYHKIIVRNSNITKHARRVPNPWDPV